MLQILRTFFLAALLAAFTAVPVFAGLLNGHGSSIVGFTGTTSFSDVSGPDVLSGTVDYAVFAPGDFPFGGYTPTPGQLTYAYQIIMNDPDNTESLSELAVFLNGDANNLSIFLLEAGDVPPSSFSFSTLLPTATAGDTANWFFESPGLDSGDMSYGLVYSSPNIPEYFAGNVVNGGLAALVIPLPVPSPIAIPEPSTVTMLGLGALALVLFRRRIV